VNTRTTISKRIDRHSPLPLYEQIKAAVRRTIVTEGLPSGSLLPTETELCAEYGVSRITVIKALNDLENEGIIERVQGKGTLVASPRIDMPMNAPVVGFSAAMLSQGLQVRTRLLASKVVTGDVRVRSLFGVPASQREQFIQLTRLRLIEGRPVVLTTSIVPRDLGEEVLKRNLEDASLYAIFESITGSHITGSDETVGIVQLGENEAKHLQVRPFSSHFMLHGKSYREGDILLEVTESIFRGDVFRFQVNMTHVILKANAFDPSTYR
jgi:GntR family transcriptional regulator